MFTVRSLGSPSPVHGPGSSVDLHSIVAHQKRGQFSQVLGAAGFARRLLLGHQLVVGLIECDLVPLCDDVDLLLNKRGEDPAGADCVAGDALSGVLQGHCLGEAHDAVLGGNISRLVDRGDEPVNGRNVDDPSPAGLNHVRQRVLGHVERRTQVEGDHLFPLVLGEVLHFVDVLDTRIVNHDVHSTEPGHSLVHKVLAVHGFSQIGVDVECLDLGVL